jgi:oxalate---CoA ligase
MSFDGPLAADSTVESLLTQRALERENAPFVLAARSPRVITYSALATASERWRVRSWQGERVGLLVGDPLEFASAFLGLLGAGAWVAPLDPTVEATTDQVDRWVETLRLTRVVADRAAPSSVGVTWEGRDAPLSGDGQLSRERGGVLLASSGTTGTPKVMALAEAQLLHAARHVVEHHRLDEHERGLSPLPLWHINAQVVGLLASLVAGASLVLEDRFHRSDFWGVVDRHEVTWINAVPAIISRLGELRAGEKVPARVRFIRSASAPLSPALLERFEAVTGVRVVESYGMTEAASQICVNPLEGERPRGSVGRAVGVEVRVTGEREGPGAVGQVEIRGPSVIERYESAHFASRFHGGWLATGDLGYLDEEGFLYLVGRTDDVINRGGEKIFPREIEEVALDVDGVAGAAVVGEADDVFGQVPILYVECEASGEARAEVLLALRQRLESSFTRVRRPLEVRVVTALPRHATGKLQRRNLVGADVTHVESLRE